MTFVTYVDLAARFSAVICRDLGGEILTQWDSRDLSHFQFAGKLARTAKDPDCLLTVCEDVPKRTQNQIDRSYKFQGAIMMASWATLDDLLFLDPARWMRSFDGVYALPREQSKSMTKTQILKARTENMRQHALRLGYEAPNLVEQWQEAHPGERPLYKDKQDLLKNQTDYVAAFLISEFCNNVIAEGGVEALRALQGVEPPYI